MACLLESAAIKHYPRQVVMINEGDIASSLYVILSGTVKVFLDDDRGREVIVNTQGPGEFFGELSLLDEAPRSASVMTNEACEFVVISKQAFDRCLLQNPQIALKLIRVLTQRIRRLTENVKDLALLDVYGRVIRTLMKMARDEQGQLIIDQKLTHQDIARMVGSSREMVSRIMKELTAGQYIRHQQGHIVIARSFPEFW